MKPSAANRELLSLEALARAPDYGSRVLKLLPAIGNAASTDVALDLFQRILALLGADAGVFLSFVRDDATRASYRGLHACDPLWACEYAARDWYDRDPGCATPPCNRSRSSAPHSTCCHKSTSS